MTLSSKNKTEKKIEEILLDMRAKGNPIFAGLSLQDISLLASECIVEDVFLPYHQSKFKNCSLLMSTRRLYKVKVRSLFEDLIEDDNVSDSELIDCFRLGVVVLGLALKSFPHFTALPYEKRRMVSVYFLNILLNGDFKEIGFNDIDKSNYLAEHVNAENIIDIGSTRWATKNHAGLRNGTGESLIVVEDSDSWAEAAMRGLPACCSYAFLSEFDKVLGLYYNWYAVEEMTKNPPDGWRVPSMGDFDLLLRTVNNDGLSLKRQDQFQNGKNGTNTSGFSALVGGYVYSDSGEFDYFGNYGGIWSSTTLDSENTRAYCLFMGPYDNGISIAYQDKGLGFNIRLIKNDNSSHESSLTSPNIDIGSEKKETTSDKPVIPTNINSWNWILYLKTFCVISGVIAVSVLLYFLIKPKAPQEKSLTSRYESLSNELYAQMPGPKNAGAIGDKYLDYNVWGLISNNLSMDYQINDPSVLKSLGIESANVYECRIVGGSVTEPEISRKYLQYFDTEGRLIKERIFLNPDEVQADFDETFFDQEYKYNRNGMLQEFGSPSVNGGDGYLVKIAFNGSNKISSMELCSSEWCVTKTYSYNNNGALKWIKECRSYSGREGNDCYSFLELLYDDNGRVKRIFPTNEKRKPIDGYGYDIQYSETGASVKSGETKNKKVINGNSIFYSSMKVYNSEGLVTSYRKMENGELISLYLYSYNGNKK